MLVRSGIVTERALTAARSAVTRVGGTIGEHLVAAGDLTDDAITDFYRQRLLVPQVSANSLAKLKPKVIAAVPADMAIELRVIPVSIDREGNLTLAMSDPSDRHAVDEVTFFSGNYVVRAVATQMQIAWCLAHYYGHVTDLGRRLMQPRVATPAVSVISAPEKIDGPSAVLAAPPASISAAAPIMLPSPPPRPVAPIDASTERTDPLAKSISTPVVHVPLAPPARKRNVQPDPPELAARFGEMVSRTRGDSQVQDEPRVVVNLEGDTNSTAAHRIPDGIQQAHSAAAPPSEPSIHVEPMVADASSAHTDDGGDRLAAARTDPAVQVPPGSDPVIITQEKPRMDDSQPILLDRLRGASNPQPVRVPMDPDEDLSDLAVVLLEQRITGRPRPESSSNRRIERRTHVGLGDFSIDRAPAPNLRPSRDTDLAEPPFASADSADKKFNGDATDPVIELGHYVGGATQEMVIPPVHVDEDLEHTQPITRNRQKTNSTRAEATAISPSDVENIVNRLVAPAKSSGPVMRLDSVDESWGPPGSTIPPPMMGAEATSGNDEKTNPKAGKRQRRKTSSIGVPIGDVPPTSNAAIELPSDPAIGALGAPPLDAAALGRELEAAAGQLVTLLRALDNSNSRDDIIGALVKHLAEGHSRAGFFAVRGGEVTIFTMTGAANTGGPAMSLEAPSTFQDVVGTRLPYRGPVVDDQTRLYLAGIFGSSPAEFLVIPVAVRDRVVGIAYADGRRKPTFDDHYAIAARAAGVALERILKSSKKPG